MSSSEERTGECPRCGAPEVPGIAGIMECGTEMWWDERETTYAHTRACDYATGLLKRAERAEAALQKIAEYNERFLPILQSTTEFGTARMAREALEAGDE